MRSLETLVAVSAAAEADELYLRVPRQFPQLGQFSLAIADLPLHGAAVEARAHNFGAQFLLQSLQSYVRKVIAIGLCYLLALHALPARCGVQLRNMGFPLLAQCGHPRPQVR